MPWTSSMLPGRPGQGHAVQDVQDVHGPHKGIQDIHHLFRVNEGVKKDHMPLGLRLGLILVIDYLGGPIMPLGDWLH